ncbi:DUF4062 domain-containing protein [Brevundimonas sp. S30B]|uniref:DUF4062 domain-containing protein n=1 Tax=unclassified Brevundimonas TaxID=2622653 RepID=UPI0010728316|nr:MULTISPECIES: DUF4062 domain-containing protein [unclassified Brevundimonas]QBX36526.1 DUF4062 domain-containing protein [Brevundimonas sp. MF30-B]TFW00826.1 DUF4062 domain-containing protein [Brevundimonas sp. S30B]
MTTAKKYQVFVSSTFTDLQEERQDTIYTILDLQHIPAGMELFPATDMEQLDYIKRIIDGCDYYVLIIGGRYGSLDPEGISYTEREYDYAVETGKFVIAFIHGDVGVIPSKFVDVDEGQRQALEQFRDKVGKGRLVRFWKSREALQMVVVKALSHAFANHPQTGWIRGDAAASQPILEQSNKLLLENADLKKKLWALETASKPKLSNLADFGDSFDIRYTYRSGHGTRVTYPETSCPLTWKQIFLGIASELGTAGRTTAAIRSGVSLAVKEFAGRSQVHTLNSMDDVRIRTQLEALGLVKIYMGKGVDGKYHEYVSLTDQGRQRFMELTAIRKAVDPTGGSAAGRPIEDDEDLPVA